MQVRLHHRSNVVGVAGAAMQGAHKVQGALGVGRAFHVYPHKAVHGGRPGHQLAHHLQRDGGVHVEAHVGQLQADVGIEAAGGDFVQQVHVERDAVSRFLKIGDVFAQIVERGTHANAVHLDGGTDGVVNSIARDKAMRKAAAEA